MVVHTQETIDGVLFMVTAEYDKDRKLRSKHLVRADLVYL